MIKFKCIFEPIFAFTFSCRQRLDSFFRIASGSKRKKKEIWVSDGSRLGGRVAGPRNNINNRLMNRG